MIEGGRGERLTAACLGEDCRVAEGAARSDLSRRHTWRQPDENASGCADSGEAPFGGDASVFH